MLDTEAPASEIDTSLYLTWTRPQQIGRVGWHATPRELCLALARLWEMCRGGRGCEAAQSLQSHRREQREEEGCLSIALAGGEPGAIAAAWLRERPDGRVMVMAVVINDPAKPIPEKQSAGIVVKALDALSRTR